MYKIILLMRRRPEMSVEDFRHYYESHHAPLATRHSAGLSRYVRRYLSPHPHPETGPATEPPFDVITELWFEDKGVFDATLAYITTHKLPPEIVEDEAKLFDRTSFRICTVEEHETDWTGAKLPLADMPD